MLPIIIVTILLIYIFSYFISYKILRKEEKKDVVKILGGLTIYTLIVSYVLLKISEAGITYNDEEFKRTIQAIMYSLIVGINLLINLPIGSKIYLERKMTNVNLFKGLAIGFVLINVIAFIVEVSYMTETQDKMIQLKHEVEYVEEVTEVREVVGN